MAKNHLTFVLCFVLFFTLHLQGQNIWTPDITSLNQGNFKQNAEKSSWSFDGTQFAASIAAAKGNQSVIIDLPMPDGSLLAFQLQEHTAMHPDLAAKFPEIRSFKAKAIGNTPARAVITWSPQGFDAQVQMPGADLISIAPQQRGSNKVLSYQKSALLTNTSMNCAVDGMIQAQRNNKTGSKTSMVDCQYRTYRTAVACTGEFAQFHGGTVPLALAAIVSIMNRVNMVLEDELALHLELVPNNNLLVYLNATTDPYTNNDGVAMLSENQANIDGVILSANYDLGHVFSTGGGGVAYVGVPCVNGFKASGVTGLAMPIGDPFAIDFVAHEIGHQLGANHTMNNDCNRNDLTAFEPGSGTSIMAYAGVCPPNVHFNSDAHYHAASLAEISEVLVNGYGSTCGTANPTSNMPPTSNAGADYMVPKSTPLILTGTGTDPNDGTLYYAWEQYDNAVSTQPPVSTSIGGPLFRAFLPTTSPSRYLPALSTVLSNSTSTWEVLPSVARTMNFRLTVRDLNVLGGCTSHDDMIITVAGTSGPFLLTSLNTTDSVTAGTMYNLTWDAANTQSAPVNCTNVDIQLSIDGGLNFNTVLATGVPNDGAQAVLIPNTPTSTARIRVKCSNNIFYDVNNAHFKIGASAAPPPFSVLPSIKHATCGDPNGNIRVTPSGGVSPYHYLWNTTDTIGMLSNLGAGTYSVTVTDSGGATWDTAFVLLTTTPPDIDRIEIYDASGTSNDSTACHNIPVNFGAYNTFGLGTGTLTWEWSTSSPLASFIGPTTGQFVGINTLNTGSSAQNVVLKVLVTDTQACKDSMNVQISAQPLLKVDTIYTTDLSGTIGDHGICFGDSIGYDVRVSPSGTYQYTWSNGAMGAVVSFAPPYNLISTVYTVTVTDQAGCNASQFSSAKGIPELQMSHAYIDACPSLVQDSMILNVTGGGQFPGGTYQMFFNQQAVGEFHTSPHRHPFSLLPGETYQVWLRDEKGCRDSISQVIPPDMCPTACVSDTFQICPTESYTLTVDAAATGFVQWFKDNAPITGANGSSYMVTEIGSYHYTSTDIAGCPVSGCCPVVFELGICNPACPPTICLPIAIMRN